MDGLDDLIRDLGRLADAIVDEAVVSVTETTALLEGRVKRHASQPRTHPRPRTGGPEGPRLLTGSYNRTIQRSVNRHRSGATGVVGTNDARAARLELGPASGVGMAYEHFGPGLDETELDFLESAWGAHVRAASRVGRRGVITVRIGGAR